mmetsp:Transcript_12850/g.19897  ORF Transcript_12850/g.19897 Transcript_12850/m.19897 type:complete len:165 (+) Transcript_12850:19-513(+)
MEDSARTSSLGRESMPGYINASSRGGSNGTEYAVSLLAKSEVIERPTESERSTAASTGIPNPNPLKSYYYSLTSAFFFSIANFILEFMGDLGVKEIYPQWMACLLLWVMYHVYAYCKSKDKDRGFFSKKHSAYYKLKEGSSDEYQFYWAALLGPILLTLNNVFI